MLNYLVALLKVGAHSCSRPSPPARLHSPDHASLDALQEAGGATLALTGVLGLAVAVAALHYLRGGPGGQARHGQAALRAALPQEGRHSAAAPAATVALPPLVPVRVPPTHMLLPLHTRTPAARKRDEGGQQQRPYDPSQPSTSAAGVRAAAAQPAAAATPAAAVARQLAGVRRVTMSVPGVLLEESEAEQLDESASVRAGVAGAPFCAWVAGTGSRGCARGACRRGRVLQLSAPPASQQAVGQQRAGSAEPPRRCASVPPALPALGPLAPLAPGVNRLIRIHLPRPALPQTWFVRWPAPQTST